MYFSLRVTPCAFNCPWETALRIVKSILLHYDVDEECYITADEKTNKYGEAIKRHFHFNFICEGKKDTIQKWIRKWYSDRDYVCRGNKSYCLRPYEEPEDLKRWLRYCMKEKYLGKLTKLPYDVDQIKEMEALAKDERSRSISVNVNKREKLLSKETLYDKIKVELEKTNLRTHQEIHIFISKYYVDQTPTGPNWRTIDGYTYKYMLTKGFISYNEYYMSGK